jgi:hypothetical protein
VYASRCRIAAVKRAQVVVVAIEWLIGHTSDRRTAVLDTVATIAIVAVGRSSSDAADCGVARLDSVAKIVVAAIERGTIDTPEHWAARLEAVARIPVATVQRRAAHAEPAQAGVVQRAGVSIATRDPIGRRASAETGTAHVTRRARIAVVASIRIVTEDATGSGDAAIVSTRIAVIAVSRRARDASDPRRTRLESIADIAIVAIERRTSTTNAVSAVRVVGRARIPVVASGPIARCSSTRATAANVVEGAAVAIIAFVGIVGVHAARQGVAGIVRAEIAVVAIERLAWMTTVRPITFLDSITDIPVVAVERRAAGAVTVDAYVAGCACTTVAAWDPAEGCAATFTIAAGVA